MDVVGHCLTDVSQAMQFCSKHELLFGQQVAAFAPSIQSGGVTVTIITLPKEQLHSSRGIGSFILTLKLKIIMLSLVQHSTSSEHLQAPCALSW